MSNIVVAATPVPGHFNPMMAIAEYLAEQNHRVTVVSGTQYRARVEAAGLQFAGLDGVANYDFSEQETYFPERSHMEPGPQQIIYDMQRIFGDAIPEQQAALQRVMAAERVDVIVQDLLFLGTFPMLMTPGMQRPAIVSCGIVPFMCRSAEVSPFAGYDCSAEGLVRNAEHNAAMAAMLEPATEWVSDRIAECGGNRLETCLFDELYARPDLFLQLSAGEFEFPTAVLPGNVRFVGPIFPAVSQADVPEWLEALRRDKPVVFVTQGTVANYDFSQLVQPTLDALAEEDVQVIVTTGGADASMLRVPANAKLVSFVPYTAMLEKTDVLVTNGGFNGVQMSLRAGVPMVCAGVSEDKPFVAARVAWSGSGIDLRTGTPSAAQVGDAVRVILADGSYKANAMRLAEAFARYDTLPEVAELLEGVATDSAVADEELVLA